MSEHTDSTDLALERLQALQDDMTRIRAALSQLIIGQHDVVEDVLVTILCGGHCLLEGVPGLAKTRLVSSLAQVMDLSFSRIQFTPDMMPTDITGTEVIQEQAETGRREYVFLPGPLFAGVVLADEINRTPPKTQAALLEAMQERHVSIGGKTHNMPTPFFVLATQNPLEQEGTYPLPEAQLDRFLMKVHIHYPSFDEEYEILESTTGNQSVNTENVIDGERLLKHQATVRDVLAPRHAIRYALRLSRATRPAEADCPEDIKPLLSWGAGPRAGQSLLLAAKAVAAIAGRAHIEHSDIRDVAPSVLRHRIMPSYEAESEGVNADVLVSRLIAHVDNTPDDESTVSSVHSETLTGA